MRRSFVMTAALALLVFVGYLLVSDSAVWVSLLKALLVAAVFGLVQLWLVRRQARRRENG